MKGTPKSVVSAVVLTALLVATHASAQSKPVVAIGPVGVAAQNISCDGWDRSIYNCNQDLAEGFRSMLETAITKTGKMDVMERMRLDSVLQEQGLSEVGLTTSGGGLGGLTGVDYYVYGTVTRFGAKQSGFSVSGRSGVGGLVNRRARGALGGGVSKSNVETEMGVDLKVTEVASGHIVVADSVSSSVKQGSAISVGGIQKAEASGDPFADVQQVVAAKIAEAIVTSRIPIKVIQVQADGTLILNYGDVFFGPGDRLAAFSVGESFVDPDTGEVLGAEETEIGVIEITRAEPRFSRAKTVSGDIGQGATLKRLVSEESSGQSKRKRSGARW
ncbi:MAG: hypothetical protein OXG81_02905 [Acidobacteria bacterium]|nr:hypothetical protein [Acidobacteriota bacterium]